MHDSSASRFRQHEGVGHYFKALAAATPHRSRVPRDPPSRGSHTVTCRTATGTCCRVNTARRSRPGAPEAASASGASSPPRAPPPRAAGRSAPWRHLRCGGAPAGLRRSLAPRQRRPEGAAAPRPPRRLSRLGPCTDRRCAGAAAARSPLPYAARRIIASLSAAGSSRKGGGKKKFSINDKPRNWGRGRGRRPMRES